MKHYKSLTNGGNCFENFEKYKKIFRNRFENYYWKSIFVYHCVMFINLIIVYYRVIFNFSCMYFRVLNDTNHGWPNHGSRASKGSLRVFAGALWLFEIFLRMGLFQWRRVYGGQGRHVPHQKCSSLRRLRHGASSHFLTTLNNDHWRVAID